MAPKIDKREEGLRELASMIAEAYRRRATGEIVSPLNASESNESDTISEAEIIVRIEPADSRPGLAYTETVRVENFINNRGRKGNHRKVDTIDSEGGQNVANKRDIRDREASPAGQDKTGDQERRR
jgi:hypothetical protein